MPTDGHGLARGEQGADQPAVAEGDEAVLAAGGIATGTERSARETSRETPHFGRFICFRPEVGIGTLL
jgi:hypothetical protein